MRSHVDAFIGTSGWSYDHWSGSFYPEKMTPQEWLAYYATQFTTVEINSTYYGMPSEETLRNWYDAVPDQFRFAVKASGYITHRKKLHHVSKSTADFMKRIGHLKEKLGPILFQLPPDWHKDYKRLAQFIDLLSEDFHYAFEFRDASWLDSDIMKLLQKHNIAHCIYQREDVVTPYFVTADFVYIRMHDPGQDHQGSYSDAQLSDWSNRITGWLQNGKPVYCYFNNDAGGWAPQNAAHLREFVSAHPV
jgi:uncharacterized protein YecE (DUF72 family)